MIDIPKGTHKTGVYHINEQPIPIIFDDNELNFPRYEGLVEDDVTPDVTANQVYEKEIEGGAGPVGIAIKIKLMTLNDVMEFVIIPDDEFITELIASKKLYFANSRGKLIFHMNFPPQGIEKIWQQNN